ncbi:response regulator transcription factor [Falseniella ignava]|uniref:Heme response regulator HssR n=2 Tax=Falseniella ignava TaxID=137730 RepID=K1LUX7_9LACT|nr:response regulator transcription factor [Falseniella ignava]EKB58726.1 hypothetical protein HMPREF9707_00155 [Falseniella ignava CCUG 37419]PKY90679.1 DNA-binding response regulator [Falseniella ignava]
MNRILIIEDDKNLLNLLRVTLEQHGFETITVTHAQQGLRALDHERIDLIVTDIMLPEIDGFEFIQQVRTIHQLTPILIVSAKETIDDKRIGFHIGADDYMVKPIDLKELVLRVEALLRRARIAQSNILQLNETKLDSQNLLIETPQQTETLPQKEFLLLFKLLSYPNQIFTRQQLMDDIWGLDSETDERTVDVHIKRLRDRFSDNPDFEIITIRGLGYKGVIKA